MEVFNNNNELLTDIFFLEDRKLPDQFVKDFVFTATKDYRYLPLFSHIYDRKGNISCHIITLHDILSKENASLEALHKDFKITQREYNDVLTIVKSPDSEKAKKIISGILSTIPKFQENINKYLGVTAPKKQSDNWSKASSDTPKKVSFDDSDESSEDEIEALLKKLTVNKVKISPKKKSPVFSRPSSSKQIDPETSSDDDTEDEIEALLNKLTIGKGKGKATVAPSPPKKKSPIKQQEIFKKDILGYTVTLASPLQNDILLDKVYNSIKNKVEGITLSKDGVQKINGNIRVKNQKDYNIYFDYANTQTRVSAKGGVYTTVKCKVAPEHLGSEIERSRDILVWIFETVHSILPEIAMRDLRPYNLTAKLTHMTGSIGESLITKTFKIKSSRFSVVINGMKKQIYYSIPKGKDAFTCNIQNVDDIPIMEKIVSYVYINGKVTIASAEKVPDLELLKQAIPVDARICQKPRQVSVRTNDKEPFLKLDNGTEVVCDNPEYPFPGFTKQKNIPCCFKTTRKQQLDNARFNHYDVNEAKFKKVYVKSNILLGRHRLTGKLKDMLSAEYSIFSIGSQATLNDTMAFFNVNPGSVLVIDDNLAVDLNYGSDDEVFIVVKYLNNHKVLVREKNSEIHFMHSKRRGDIKKLYPGQTNSGQSYCRNGKVFFKMTEHGIVPVVSHPCNSGVDISSMVLPTQEQAIGTLKKTGMNIQGITISGGLVTSIKSGNLFLPVKKEELRVDLPVLSSKFYLEILGVEADHREDVVVRVPRSILKVAKTRNYEDILEEVSKSVPDETKAHNITVRLINEQDRYFK